MMGRNWVIIGVIGVFSSWCIYSFYSVVGGWTIGYTVIAATGQLNITDSAELTGILPALLVILCGLFWLTLPLLD